MDNVEKFESGTRLLDALKSGELSEQDVYVGMVKESEKEDHIAFAPGSCEEGWIDVPAELIGNVEVLRHVPCRDHSHPLVRLELAIDESNPVHTMVRQMFASAGSRSPGGAQLPMGAMPAGTSYWSGAGLASGVQQGQQSGVAQAATWSTMQARSPVAVHDTARFASIPGVGTNHRSRVALAAPLGPIGGGRVGLIECDIDCCVACCRDCFPFIGCVDYPCCELSNCKISL